MFHDLKGKYTLIIPTYNRAAELKRVLAYLERRSVDFTVLVLDSSEQKTFEENERTIAKTDVPIRHTRYDSSIPPYQKFSEGLYLVDTPYCSFCADDDVVFTDAIKECVDFLEANPFFVAAHGYYVNFREQPKSFDLTYTIYDGETISGDNALKRLMQQLRYYQAIFYAIYRTPVLQRAHEVGHRMRFVLFQEVLASSIAIVHGGVARLKSFYLARSTAPSVPYSNWHPHEIIAKDAASLFREYWNYRDVVLKALLERDEIRDGYGPERTERILDLLHLRYLAPLLDSTILDFMLDSQMAGQTPRETVNGVWERWVFSGSVGRMQHRQLPYPPSLQATRLRGLTRRVVDKIWPGRLSKGLPPPTWLDPYRDYWLNATLIDGGERRYLLYDEFVFQRLANGRRPEKRDIDRILEHLNAYV